MKKLPALDWLLEEDQPSIRYLALMQILGREEHDPEVRTSKKQIPKKGWAKEILAKEDPSGGWASSEGVYKSRHYGTHWMLLILSDLGLTKSYPAIARNCEQWIKRLAKPDGGFGFEAGKRSHLCIAGNVTRALIKFGYIDHPRVKRSLQWLIENQSEKGGWSCSGKGSNLDSWEALSGIAEYPRERWTRSMRNAVEKGAEYYLQSELHRQGGRYEPWYRFHYPVHYYYDLLVGLDFMTRLGYINDKRMDYAISLLKQKRRPDGKWNLDAVHPDVEGWVARLYRDRPESAPKPFALETAHTASKMITLGAMRVLHRLGESI